MNKDDQRLIKAVLGGLGAVAGAFASVPAIALPVAFESIVISATSILLDTFGEEPQAVGPAHISPPPVTHHEGVTITVPHGTDIKIEN